MYNRVVCCRYSYDSQCGGMKDVSEQPSLLHAVEEQLLVRAVHSPTSSSLHGPSLLHNFLILQLGHEGVVQSKC